jgi:hypothetical protein
MFPLQVGDVFPKGVCRNSQRCDFNSGTFKLVTIPATKKCSADECFSLENSYVLDKGKIHLTYRLNEYGICLKRNMA